MLGIWGAGLMEIDIELAKKIRLQIAHVMARYGDEPEEFLYKLECLVMEWYLKGQTIEKH
jgi:hypothetical protein